jgi:hypothetical protein
VGAAGQFGAVSSDQAFPAVIVMSEAVTSAVNDDSLCMTGSGSHQCVNGFRLDPVYRNPAGHGIDALITGLSIIGCDSRGRAEKPPQTRRLQG